MDGLGTVRQILDASQNVENQYDYEGFGTEISSNENIYNRFRYTGREYDDETLSANSTALYYYRARTYDSSAGSFTSRDPIPYANLYPYCFSNPINFTDPEGKLVYFSNKCCDSKDCWKKLFEQLGYSQLGIGMSSVPIDKDSPGWGKYYRKGYHASRMQSYLHLDSNPPPNKENLKQRLRNHIFSKLVTDFGTEHFIEPDENGCCLQKLKDLIKKNKKKAKDMVDELSKNKKPKHMRKQ